MGSSSVFKTFKLLTQKQRFTLVRKTLLGSKYSKNLLWHTRGKKCNFYVLCMYELRVYMAFPLGLSANFWHPRTIWCSRGRPFYVVTIHSSMKTCGTHSIEIWRKSVSYPFFMLTPWVTINHDAWFTGSYLKPTQVCNF